MVDTIFNPNELVLERVKSVIFPDYATGQIIGRLTQIEDPTLEITSEADEVLDASGATIDTIRRGKKAKFDSVNSLFSTDLFAMQMGTKKKVATAEQKIVAAAESILMVDTQTHTITLPKSPVKDSLKYIYKFVNKGLAEVYELSTGDTLTGNQFSINDKTITLPDDATGEYYVAYDYESAQAISIDANAEKFPETTGFKAFALFKDVCDASKKYMGVIIAKRAQLDPSSVSLALKFDGKHPFSVSFNKEYCDENADLFTIVIPQD